MSKEEKDNKKFESDFAELEFAINDLSINVADLQTMCFDLMKSLKGPEGKTEDFEEVQQKEFTIDNRFQSGLSNIEGIKNKVRWAKRYVIRIDEMTRQKG